MASQGSNESLLLPETVASAWPHLPYNLSHRKTSWSHSAHRPLQSDKINVSLYPHLTVEYLKINFLNFSLVDIVLLKIHLKK